MNSTLHIFREQTLELHPFKAIFWQEKATLILADIHFGKARHFRSEGIPVPLDVENNNWDKLISLIIDYQPKRVLILGDLFHSSYNSAWEELVDFVAQFEHIVFELVMGNHDIFEPKQYIESGFKVNTELVEPPFHFTHEPLELESKYYNLCGHIHPCVFMTDGRKNRLRLPTFYFGKTQGILPAFGAFTGMHPVEPRVGDTVFVVGDESVIKVS